MTESQSTKLFTPTEVGVLDLQHRVVMAPLTRKRAEAGSGIPADFTAEYYAQRASLGGLLISEGTSIAEEAGGYANVPALGTRSSSNDREEKYGGSIENRSRFPLRVLTAVCKAIGPDRVGIRMSPFSHFQGTREEDPLALFVPWTEAIAKAQPSLAFVHAVGPRAFGSRDTPKHLQQPEDCLNAVWNAVSQTGIKLIVAGGYLPETAIQHASETDDLVAFGRYFISNPDLPARIENGWKLRKYGRETFYTQTTEGYTDLPTYNARL
ncbi:hypothetical protein QQX98_012602 [Neonectria punicea]|uniref:NADH:flavin oxidoreductase/NADH oxidase N-terminal domain-containing protein n=1 Tax=Neonectria punicea TaxID=979145 RepID=A0ABR1GID1_9HYPO